MTQAAWASHILDWTDRHGGYVFTLIDGKPQPARFIKAYHALLKNGTIEVSDRIEHRKKDGTYIGVTLTLKRKK